MQLKTKRLVLRPLALSDAKEISKHTTNLHVSQHLAVVPHPNTVPLVRTFIRNSKKKMAKKPIEGYTFAIVLADTKELIGCIGASEVNDFTGKATIGYWFAEFHWGNGYAPEALRAVAQFLFTKRKLRRLEAIVHTDNPASAKVLEKIGFIKEGVLRKATRSKATKVVHDVWLYGLLKEEFRA
jgi:[ribosomal protein S5]-alanine N-acetyltransferase